MSGGIILVDSNGAREKIAAVCNEFVMDFVEIFCSRTKRNSPHDTGHNADSVTIGGTVGSGLNVHTESGYGAYLELGTRHMAARPYFAPAFEETLDDFRRAGWARKGALG